MDKHWLGVYLVYLDRGVVRVLLLRIGLIALIELLELAHFVQFEVVVVFALLRLSTVLVLHVAWVQTLLLCLELDSVVLICLLLLFPEK